MRDSLFRAAQQGNYFPMEEPVAQLQDRALTEQMFDTSLYEVECKPALLPKDEEQMILWPYPKGTGDCIDRANCTDDFLRSNPDFQVVTELGLANQPSLSAIHDDLVVFAPFEVIVPELEIDDDGYLVFRGKRGHAMLNELSLGYLYRRGIVNLESSTNEGGESELTVSPGILTHFINGTRLGLSKALQMDHFQRLSTELKELGVRAINHQVVYSEEQLLAAAASMLKAGLDIVIRPFSASQGTGVSFLSASSFETSFESDMQAVLQGIRAQVQKKYGAEIYYPLTLSPFVESTKIRDCVTDIRIFVIYDPKAGGLRSLPAMVRVAQVPLRNRMKIDPACAATNLNIPQAPDAVPGSRVLPVANDEVLKQIGIDRERLMALGKSATLLWGKALEIEKAESGSGDDLQFSYGSVDFVIADEDKAAVPIEMNGNNVGSHPAVHPKFLSSFGEATTSSLKNLGIGDRK